MQKDSSWVAVGRIRKPFGLKGEVAVEALGETVEHLQPGQELFLRQHNGERLRLVVAGLKILTRKIVLSFEGIENVDDVEKWRGCPLEMSPAELPELEPDQFYFYQLLGLDVTDASGRPVGIVKDVMEGPAQPLLVIKSAGKEILIPFVGDFIQQVDLEDGVIHLGDVQGLLEL